MRQIYIIAIIFLVLPGCATMMSDNHHGYPVFSTPQGALVTVNGLPHGHTPVIITTDPDRDLLITIERPSCPVFQTVVASTTNPWTFGNILIGGIVGLIIDSATGAMYQYEPRSLTVLYGESSHGTCMIIGSNIIAQSTQLADWRR